MNEILVQQILSTYIVIRGRVVQPANMGDFVSNSPSGAQIVDTKAT